MRAFYKPVLAFARDRFVRDDGRAVHESLLSADSDEPRLSDGVNIVVEPRGAVGELRIVHVGPPFYAPGTWWAETLYCLHVLDDGGTTTIAVEELLRRVK